MYLGSTEMECPHMYHGKSPLDIHTSQLHGTDNSDIVLERIKILLKALPLFQNENMSREYVLNHLNNWNTNRKKFSKRK